MIYIDSREYNGPVPSLLGRLNVPTQRVYLEVGDYVVGSVLVERKHIDDYLTSLASGRLHDQLYALSYNSELSYLIIEGYVSEALLRSRMRRQAYLSSLVGSSFKRAPDGKQGQIITINVETPWDTALVLKYLWQKIKEGEPRLPARVGKSAPVSDLLVGTVASIPGVGKTRAIKLLEHFKTIEALMLAKPEDIAQVEGIGKTLSTKIYEWWRKPYHPEVEEDAG